MSGLLGSVLGQLGGLLGSQGNAQAGAGNLLSQVLNAAGGPAGILQKFQQAGLGEKAQSWIGSGHNLPVSADEINQVFPNNELDSIAQKYGLPAGMATQILAQLLPHAVDHSTPDGTLPQQGASDATSDTQSSANASSTIDFGSMIGRLTGSK